MREIIQQFHSFLPRKRASTRNREMSAHTARIPHADPLKGRSAGDERNN